MPLHQIKQVTVKESVGNIIEAHVNFPSSLEITTTVQSMTSKIDKEVVEGVNFNLQENHKDSSANNVEELLGSDLKREVEKDGLEASATTGTVNADTGADADADIDADAKKLVEDGQQADKDGDVIPYEVYNTSNATASENAEEEEDSTSGSDEDFNSSMNSNSEDQQENLTSTNAVKKKKDRKSDKSTKSDRKSSRKSGRKSDLKNEQEELVPLKDRMSFSITTPCYNFDEHLNMYNTLYGEAYPQLMAKGTKFFMQTEFNNVGTLDQLFTSFCDILKMKQVKVLSVAGGERVFCWLGKKKANQILPILKSGHHFVNKLPLDVGLKDKQILSQILKPNVYNKFANFPAHKCPYQNNEEIKFQLLCPHNYANHTWLPCEEEKCREMLANLSFTKFQIAEVAKPSPCPCFKNMFFIPETHVLTSRAKQQMFIEEIKRSCPTAQWIVKPSYVKGGRGIQILSSPEQVFYFFKLHDQHRRHACMTNYVIQRYISKPMLTNKKQKFDIRAFVLMVATKYRRCLGFYHPGFIRKVPLAYEEIPLNGHYKARHHLANTRVWNKYQVTDKPADKTPKEKTPKNKKEKKAKTPKAGKKGKKGDKKSDRVKSYMETYADDECEEYNKAVTEGCLSDPSSTVKLPPLPTNFDIKAEIYNNPFARILFEMVNSMCEAMYEIIKDNANCYQTFSMDIVVDQYGSPWLLEVNPTIMTENVNWNSKTIRDMIPAIFIESLALVNESTRKCTNFLPLHTPADFTPKPNDLVFRENFLFWHSTPYSKMTIIEMLLEKFKIEEEYKKNLILKGVPLKAIDYLPHINNPAKFKAEQEKIAAEKKAKEEKKAKADAKAAKGGKGKKAVKKPKKSDKSDRKSSRKSGADKKIQVDPEALKMHKPKVIDDHVRPRVPSPVAKIPVLPEDIWATYKYKNKPIDFRKQIAIVRKQHRATEKRRNIDVLKRKQEYEADLKRQELEAHTRSRIIV